MALRIYDYDLGNLLIKRDHPGIFLSKGADLHEQRAQLEHPIAQGYFHEIAFDSIHIGYGSATFSEKVRLHFESDFETVEMHFALRGKSAAISDRFSRGIGFEANQHNIVYANKMQGEMQWESKDMEIFEINFAPDFFKRFLPEGSMLFDRFRHAIENGLSGALHPYNNRTSHRMLQLIGEMMQCNRKGLFKKMFLEAKVIELLLLQLEQLNEAKSSSTSLKKSDIDKIYAVREYLLENLHTTCSLMNLALHVGTNEFTLKKGFKELFGTTVFGFWNDAKMEQAKTMLTEQQMTVGEVSYHTGYKDQRHFSAAFKRKYGLLPSQLKK